MHRPRRRPAIHSPFAYFANHPRRLGFIIFNLVTLALVIAWGFYTANVADAGLVALPSLMLGYTGMVFLIIIWVVAWLAWGWMVYARYRRHHQKSQQ